MHEELNTLYKFPSISLLLQPLMYIYLASHTSSFFSLEANLRHFFSGNYGGALGANALAKGLEGNKSLRVHPLLLIFYVL